MSGNRPSGRYSGQTVIRVEWETRQAHMDAAEDRFYRAEVVRREDFAADLWMIRIRCQGEFTFTPGQYATLGVEVEGKRIERPYSIASAPWEQEIEFFFELVPEGALTPHLYKLQPGDCLSMRKVPKGRFTLDRENGRTHHLLISTVTGVAPFVSFVRTLGKDFKEGKFDGSHKLYLLNGASRPWDHADWPGEIGRADDVLRKYADQWGLDASNTVAYLCGHPEMIERSKAILKRRGFIDRAAVKEEVYWVPPKA